MEDLGAQEVSISPEIENEAISASAAYGKALGHVADLNFGDCFAYVCAKVLGVALRYKGNDLSVLDGRHHRVCRTDVCRRRRHRRAGGPFRTECLARESLRTAERQEPQRSDV